MWIFAQSHAIYVIVLVYVLKWGLLLSSSV